MNDRLQPTGDSFPAMPSSWKQLKLPVLLILVVLFLTAAILPRIPGLDAPMYHDSARIMLNRDVFEQDGFWGVLNIFPQRPVAMATFYLSFLLGDMDASLFRLTNLGILALTGLVVSYLVFLLLDLRKTSGPDIPQWKKWSISLFLGLFFVLHPLQTYTALYIWQRMALLCCLFGYASLAAYLEARRAALPGIKAAGYGFCLVLFGLALMSKENAVVLPAAFILAEIAFFRTSWKGLLARTIIYFGILLAAIFLLSELEHAHGRAWLDPGIIATISRYYDESEQTVWQVLLTQTRMVFLYLTQIVSPLPDGIHFLAPQIISRSLTDPWTTLPATIGVVGLVALGLVFLRTRPLCGFGILFCLIGLLPEALLVPQFAYLGYRAVFPMLGILLVVADLILVVLAAPSKTSVQPVANKAVGVCLVAILIFVGWSSFALARVWADPVRLWKNVVERFGPPERIERRAAGTILNNLGVALQFQEKHSEAVGILEASLRYMPEFGKTHSALGNSFVALDKLPEATAAYEQAIRLLPEFAHPYTMLAAIKRKEGKLQEELRYLQRATELAPRDYVLQNRLGEAYERFGDLGKAEAHFSKALQMNPLYAGAHLNLGVLLLNQDDVERAIAHLRKAVELRSDSWQAHNNLGVALARSGKPREALVHFQKAVTIRPTDPSSRENLETALKQLKDETRP
ncbi:MAG: tetratricopeptide repeat protein [Thermodesulfobacteriota bacterium]